MACHLRQLRCFVLRYKSFDTTGIIGYRAGYPFSPSLIGKIKEKVAENAKYLPELKSEIALNTANAYKDKQYVDSAGALKYFNEDGSVNFAQYLADTANISLYDPIALDLNANGKIDTLSLENGVFFDHNGDEIAFKSSWISAEDGIKCGI